MKLTLVLLLVLVIGRACAEERELLAVDSGGGGGAPGSGGGSGDSLDTYRGQKTMDAMAASHAAIDKAAERASGAVTKRTAGMVNMYAVASTDDSVTRPGFEALEKIAGGRRLGEGPGIDTSDGNMETSRAIELAATGKVKPLYATAAGADMAHVVTNPVPRFSIDHVKDMGKRLLLGGQDRVEMEPLWAMQNTAEAVESTGVKSATKWGGLNAAAASGTRGNDFVAQMGDTVTHRLKPTDRRLLHRKVLMG